MAKSIVRIPKDKSQSRQRFISEKFRIEKNFLCFKCEIKKNLLRCMGSIEPSEGCNTYYVRIDYIQNEVPQVFITDPVIEPRSEYHMFNNGALCLYDHRESPWNEKMLIHETIIPWLAEWIVLYEAWKITGKWYGPAASHGSDEKIPESKKHKGKVWGAPPKRESEGRGI